jgi:LmbE family N-acetylglucosaminyl deacetylase
MVVVAHPGDEAFGFGGAIAKAAAEGAYVVVVCATRGWFDARLTDSPPMPGGKNRDVKFGAINWRNIDTVREDELRRSVALLGVRVVRMLDYAEAISIARISTTWSAGSSSRSACIGPRSSSRSGRTASPATPITSCCRAR